ncbi:molecular chaperone DnaJ [Agaribacterium haliotis]|uniref:molecular chaperone DnaJ n=1 Tax=Agaribacterium haliotis TaxID=2013869 RepID=UPI000BB55F54|nr:molecular chaperone DnaJ [Agaribacterium haliotis]
MIFKLIPILIVVFLVWLFSRSLKKMPPKERRARLFQYLSYGLIALLLIAVVTGRLHWFGAVAAGALAIAKIGASTALRFLPFLQMGRRAGLFKNPVFRTEHIEMRLDLQSGKISGQVLSGEFAGKQLDELSDSELTSLQQSLESQDKRAWYLLGVYRQRRGGPNNQQQQQQHYQNDSNLANPSIDEARLILGLDEQYSKKDIDLAYKRLMQKLHPDRGGNDYLASRVNLARDLLIKHIDNK